jgi:hypothetical protein
LRLAAQSMNLYYTAAALADSPTKQRWRTLRMALAAAILDPTHETRNKAGLLLRTALPRRILSQFRQLRRQVPVGETTPS